MEQLFISLVLGVGWVWGVHCLFQEKMVLGSLGNIVRDNVPSWLSKPMFDCPPCMSSLHGTFVFLFLMTVQPIEWHLWLFYIISLCGINYIIKLWLYA